MEEDRLKLRRETQTAKILRAAQKLLSKVGYKEFSMRRLAKTLDVTPGSLYFYFKDKDHLIRELCDAEYVNLAHKEKEAQAVKDPFERLYQICAPYVDLAIEKPDQFRVLFLEPVVAKLPIDSRIQRGSAEEDPYQIFMESVRDVLIERKIKPSEKFLFSVSHLIWALGHGIGSLHIAFKDDPWFELFDPQKQLKVGLAALIEGLKPTPSQKKGGGKC